MSTPYDLRFEIYNAAKDRLTEQYYQDAQAYTEWNRINSDFEGKCPVDKHPSFPDHEEIREEAEKIYEFVQTK